MNGRKLAFIHNAVDANCAQQVVLQDIVYLRIIAVGMQLVIDPIIDLIFQLVQLIKNIVQLCQNSGQTARAQQVTNIIVVVRKCALKVSVVLAQHFQIGHLLLVCIELLEELIQSKLIAIGCQLIFQFVCRSKSRITETDLDFYRTKAVTQIDRFAVTVSQQSQQVNTGDLGLIALKHLGGDHGLEILRGHHLQQANRSQLKLSAHQAQSDGFHFVELLHELHVLCQIPGSIQQLQLLFS